MTINNFARTLCAALVFAAAAIAQDPLPANFGAAGFGIQHTSSPQTSGWVTACHRNPDTTLFGLTVPSYLCASTDYTTQGTSARVDVDSVVYHGSRFAFGTKTGAGAALNAAGVGGSFALGGWGTADISGITKVPGARLVASITWQKDDISASQSAGTGILRQLAARAVFRFGFGKTW